jgi:F plasmid transfer operon, TraF, protein
MEHNLVYSKLLFLFTEYSRISHSRICRTRLTACVVMGAYGALMAPMAARAQGLETLGTRAAALGAFVAVADDASAVAWNPAGLVTGPIFNIMLDFGRATDQPADPPAAGSDAARLATTLIAMGSTPVGLGYYRLTTTTAGVATPAVVGTPDRQDSQVVVRTLVTSHLGATVQQSVGAYLTLGAMVKLVRGNVAGATRIVSSWDDALDAADRLESTGTSRGDVDLGAMVALGRLRGGIVVRNVTEPTFGEDQGTPVRLERHARAGLAWGDRWPGVAQTIVAVDVDLTDVPSVKGERRDVAGGVERWSRGHKVGVRGGVRASAFGDARPIVSGGASYAVRSGMYADVYFARGRGDERAWGVAARLSY